MRLARMAAPLVVTGAFAALTLVACGGGPSDDEASGSVEAYCELSNRLNDSASGPSDEELDQLIAVAPDEIRDEVRTLVEAIQRGEFFSEEVGDADEAVSDYDAENCGRAPAP